MSQTHNGPGGESIVAPSRGEPAIPFRPASDEVWIGGQFVDGNTSLYDPATANQVAHMQARPDADGSEFWIGRHSADGDTLVFDPANNNAGSGNLCFFSLTQLRPRSFPPAVVKDKIREITDTSQLTEARERYEQWPKLKAELDEQNARASEQARTEAGERRREDALEQHRSFLEERNLPFEGVQDSASEAAKASRRRRRTRCYICRRDLDNGIESQCVGCGYSICSCGACGCGYPAKAGTA